jgi:uncharacterized glyoxalase superfamily protein PhnB
MKFTNAVPVIATSDVLATVAYYTFVLGFTQHFVFGDPPVYAAVQRDGVLVYISLDVDLAAKLEESHLHPDVFLWVKDVDEAFEEHKQRGAKIIEEPVDKAWDARQYVIEDPNGYYLKIAEPLDVTEQEGEAVA